MTADSIHISLSAETIFHVGNFAITNSMFTTSVVSFLMILIAVLANRQLKATDRPTGLQNFVEWVIEALFTLVHSITQDLKKTNRFFPLIATFFLFILLNNWFGLLPGVGSILKSKATDEHAIEEVAQEPAPPLFRAGTADLNTTLALALISILATQLFGMQSQKLSYFKKFLNFSSPIMFFVGILELISEFAKIISFAFRLFGNIFAGEVLLVVIAALLPLGVPLPFYGLELFVGFIQALVFSMLSLVFFNMATISHDEH
ncbi:MAG: F0F1 ATP synthase subunit A [Candidatus Pacebacteria bacterium]|nr:F0F1 ATP synthase subunit A [Candidatus Paceibacterota bacterium]PIR61057.1 MAG: ATP synthase F0 subunit A [Candidatus Pacebacteria bacterium CG10_big_fil_rev_8_21_14_0_10_45_6]